MAINLALTEQDKKAVQAVLPAVRRTSPKAATVISRLLRAAAVIEDPAVRPYASVGEVARAFSVTDQTVRNWVDRGWLPADRRFGRGPRRIPRSVLASANALRSHGRRSETSLLTRWKPSWRVLDAQRRNES